MVRASGTQFELRLAEAALRLSVREGRVAVSGPAPVEAVAGERLLVGAGGVVEKGSIAPTAADWRWAQDAASPPEIEGRPLGLLLDWYARESGRTWRYADPAFETRPAPSSSMARSRA